MGVTTTCEAVALDPLLKWAGGKRWQLPRLAPIWAKHAHRRLVEPCVGGMAVALGLRPERALLNDKNPHLVNFYRYVRDGFGPMPHAKTDAEYRAARARFNALVRTGRQESEEAAGLFYLLNRCGFNGLVRFNRKGEFNVPWCKRENPAYASDFTAHREALENWTLTEGDATDVPLEPEDFVYCDPPYDGTFDDYSAGGFSWADQVRVAEWLASHRGPVILCNANTVRVNDLYARLGFSVALLEAPRRIACNGNRVPALEVFAGKNLQPAKGVTERGTAGG